MPHPTIPIGQLEEIDATKYKPGLALIQLLTARFTPDGATNLLIMAIVDHIDNWVKKEMQLEVAEGIAKSIIANIQHKEGPKAKKLYPKVMRKLSQLGVPPEMVKEIISDAKSADKTAISLIKSAKRVKL